MKDKLYHSEFLVIDNGKQLWLNYGKMITYRQDIGNSAFCGDSQKEELFQNMKRVQFSK